MRQPALTGFLNLCYHQFMNNDNLTQQPKKKKKVYNLDEKEYAQAKRDRKRLKEIKPLITKIAKITSQVK